MQPIKTDEKTSLLYRQWDARSPKAVILLVHGLGAHSGRWEFLSDTFLRNDISSYAIELKGFGQTKDLKGHIDSFDIYSSDIRRLHDIIREDNPGRKVHLLGESMGAIIAILMAVIEPALFDGLICISPAFQSKLKFSLLDYVKMALALLYNPKKQLDMPFTSEMATRDAEYQKVMDSSDMEHRLATPRLLLNIAVAQVRARLFIGKIKIPVLFLLAGEDKLVDSGIAKRAFSFLKVEDKEMIEYPDMYHALSIDVGKEKVFEDILKWMIRRI